MVINHLLTVMIFEVPQKYGRCHEIAFMGGIKHCTCTILFDSLSFYYNPGSPKNFKNQVFRGFWFKYEMFDHPKLWFAESLTQALNVWYIYLDLFDFNGKCKYISS